MSLSDLFSREALTGASIATAAGTVLSAASIHPLAQHSPFAATSALGRAVKLISLSAIGGGVLGALAKVVNRVFRFPENTLKYAARCATVAAGTYCILAITVPGDYPPQVWLINNLAQWQLALGLQASIAIGGIFAGEFVYVETIVDLEF